MRLFRRRNAAQRQLDQRLDAQLRADVVLTKVIEDFSPLFPDDAEARERLGLALKRLVGSRFEDRMRRYQGLVREAKNGDEDAALRYFRAARAEIVLALQAEGSDASVFMRDHWIYGPFVAE